MNKVIIINLDGAAYQLEDGGYETLRAYLDNALARLAGNPDRDEILLDIERAIAEKFRRVLTSYKTVVVTTEVTAVLAEMGPIDAGSGGAPDPGLGNATSPNPGMGSLGNEQMPPPPRAPKRLYRVMDGAMLSGVCNGLAAYLHWDPTIIRLAFVILLFCFGTGILAYIVMAIVIPEAKTPEERAAASSDSPTAQEFIRRAREGYYSAMKDFPGKHREWRRQFRRDMRRWRREFRAERRYGWHGWGSYAETAPGPMGTPWSPLFSLLHVAALLLFVCSLISLLSHDAIFGIHLSPDVPTWLAVVILILVYKFFTMPLRAFRHAHFWGIHPLAGSPWHHAFDAFIWLFMAVALVWLGTHFFPELRTAVHSIPGLVHQAANDLRTWWNDI